MAATVVENGRRKGLIRRQGEQFPVKTNAEKPQKVTVLSPKDWSRIQASLSGEDKERDIRQRRHQHRIDQHERSKNTVKNWENTIEGQRLKKLQARKQREEKEEEERQRIDKEEAEYQAQQRKDAIDRAKTLLYYETDRIKGFHSALVLSEVLKEREKQIAFKKMKEKLLENKDQEYFVLQQEERERGILSDQKIDKERILAKQEVAKFQAVQREEHAREAKLMREAQLQEQAAIEEDVKKYFEEEKEKELQRQQRRVALKEDLDLVVRQNNERREQQRKQELAEAEENRIFAAAKKKMTKMRKEKELEIFQEFQNHQDKMIDKLSSQMQQKTSNEDEKIAKAVAEQEAKKAAEVKAKDQKYIQSMRDIHVHTMEMLAEQERKRRELKELDAEILKQRVVQDQKFHAQQMEKRRKAALQAKANQEFHKSQVEQQVEKELLERQEDLDHFEQNMALLKVEEEQFHEYANQVIKSAQDRGAPTHPLKVVAKSGAGGGRGPVFSGKGGVRPSYQVTDGYRVELPSYAYKGPLPPALRRKDTKKRMGFTW